MGIHLYKN